MSEGDDSQVVLHDLTKDVNLRLGVEHHSYHVVTSKVIAGKEGDTLELKIKSNDGELYEVKLFKPKEKVTSASVIMAKPLYVSVPVQPYHQDKLKKHLEIINQTYKATNTSYEIQSVHQQLDDENNEVYRVVGSDDGKKYKIKIQRPAIQHVGQPVARKDQA